MLCLEFMSYDLVPNVKLSLGLYIMLLILSTIYAFELVIQTMSSHMYSKSYDMNNVWLS